MRLLRAKHLILTVTAMFSLFVSAVSACACSHHEPVKVEASTCHSSSHEAPPAEPSSTSPHIETDCSCFVLDPAPAVVAKKEDTRTAVEEQLSDVLEIPFAFAIELEVAASPDGTFDPPVSNYHHALLSSLPSRAPPRL